MTEESGFKAKSLKRKNVKGLKLGGGGAPAAAPSIPDTQAPGGNGSRYYAHNDQLSDQLSTLEIGVEFKLDLRAEDLKVVNELGAGNGGTVSKVIHAPTKALMAKKVIHIDAKPSVRKQIVRELHIMQECHSPYIVSFYGAFLNEGDVVMCMEYMDCGSLDSIAKKIGPIRIDVLGKISEAVVEGLNYLYNVHRILHRDVKPSNILVNSRGSIKLCDFGVSGELINSIADTFVGTSTYMSPERIKGAKYSVKSDVWSLGLTLLELAIGRFPFDADGTSAGTRASAGPMGILDLLQKIVNEPAPKLPKNKAFPPSLEKMIEHCLIKDPEQRPSPQELLEESFMRAAKQTNVDLEAWAHLILDKPLNRSSRSSQLISPAPAHRESPAPPRPSSRGQNTPGRRTSTAERSSSERGTERERSDREHRAPPAPLQQAPFPTRTSSHGPGSGRPEEINYHSSAGDPSRGNQLPQSRSSRQAQHRSNTEPAGLPKSDRNDSRERYSRGQGGEREREREREREYVQGTIGIGFEGARQPEMKEKKKQPPVGIMSSGGGLSFVGSGNGIGSNGPSGINSGR
ncbi:kinase-like protein [Choiromyces venosus 120613-1]|uniref:Kinase-like protein n=1 Tax=Choiromyces venosus 120613-1 TaxID=1336337 RepID=A0A3N4JMQ6_9PEZI|nr:kinase-like protein [Choiromyces venosus 120613-1]